MEGHFKEVGNEEGLKQLSKLGYNDQLWSTFSRSFILTVHSDKPLEAQLGDAVSTNLDDAALVLNLEQNGHTKENNPEVSLKCTPRE